MIIETKNIAHVKFERPIPDFSNVGVKITTKIKLKLLLGLPNTAKIHARLGKTIRKASYHGDRHKTHCRQIPHLRPLRSQGAQCGL